MSKRRAALWVLLAMAIGAALSLVGAQEETAPALPGQIGTVVDRQLREISGLVVSPTDRERLWVLNDSGNAPRLYALDRTGKRTAVVQVAGARNRDWEDLAAAQLDGRAMLVIGDIGDNSARRPYVTLYLVEEPAVSADRQVGVVRPERVIHFRYPDGPRDAEGLAVDVAGGEVLVLSKRATPPALYAVPLDSDTPQPKSAVTARHVADVATIPPPTLADMASDPAFGLYSSQPTALDYAPGLGLLVMTYARPYLYRQVAEDSTLADLVGKAPQPVPSVKLAQAEAAVIDGDHVLFTSEKLPAPVLRLPLGGAAARDDASPTN